MLLRIVCLLLLAGFTAGCGAPATSTSRLQRDSIYLENVWARPSPVPNGNTAVYFTVVNPLDSTDRLLGVSSKLGIASLHESTIENGVARMESLPDGIEIPARSSVELAPGGRHIMVMGVAEPLAVGDQVTVTLNFELLGAMTITAPVEEQP